MHLLAVDSNVVRAIPSTTRPIRGVHIVPWVVMGQDISPLPQPDEPASADLERLIILDLVVTKSRRERENKMSAHTLARLGLASWMGAHMMTSRQDLPQGEVDSTALQTLEETWLLQ